ncbi:NUMOD1 domain-containing DNA-binding protein [Gelidibacter sp.]|uniref:NUMOD1 domain-containing DNA-binding protein n=1 Tax=Gelidibacter sp. TaxID=2018083 RepID=UPI00326553A8
METKGIIYTVTHVESGKSYVGCSTNSMYQRQLDHTERAQRGEKGKFHEAIATHGPEAFSWTQIDTANSTNELAQKEKDYIVQYDSKDNGFNSDSGGGIQKTVYQYSVEDGSLVAEYDSLGSAGNAVNASRTSIGNTCLGQNKTCMGYHWSYSLTVPYILSDDREKCVIQADMDGITLAEYKSVAEASRRTGISKTCISRVCRGEREQAGGYIWKYI